MFNILSKEDWDKLDVAPDEDAGDVLLDKALEYQRAMSLWEVVGWIDNIGGYSGLEEYLAEQLKEQGIEKPKE